MSETSHFSKPAKAVDAAREGAGQAASAASDFGERLGQSAADAGDAVRDATRAVGDAATGVGPRAYETGQRAGQSLAEQVEKQPMMSLVAAATVGLLAGMLLARR